MPRARATCHPPREARGLGLCGSCYEIQRLKNNPQQKEKAILTWRRCHLLERYGVTLEDYDKILRKQNGVCKICRKHKNTKRHLVVDHDHITGVIRGLLCDSCNMKLEWYINNQKTIEDYVGHWSLRPWNEALSGEVG